MRFRPLKADEVECRIGQVAKSGNGLSLLLYKTARVDADILDEAVGPENWQCEFYEQKGTLFCKVGIRIARDEQFADWVWKDDAGSPSNMEAEKGEASDAFKRACFKWGIGRELYTAPFIWVPADKCEIKGGKCYDRFEVVDFEARDGMVTRLAVKNGDKGIVYTFPRRYEAQRADASGQARMRDYSAMTALKVRFARATGVSEEAAGAGIAAKYGDFSKMDDGEYQRAVQAVEMEVLGLEAAHGA